MPMPATVLALRRRGEDVPMISLGRDQPPLERVRLRENLGIDGVSWILEDMMTADFTQNDGISLPDQCDSHMGRDTHLPDIGMAFHFVDSEGRVLRIL